MMSIGNQGVEVIGDVGVFMAALEAEASVQGPISFGVTRSVSAATCGFWWIVPLAWAADPVSSHVSIPHGLVVGTSLETALCVQLIRLDQLRVGFLPIDYRGDERSAGLVVESAHV